MSRSRSPRLTNTERGRRRAARRRRKRWTVPTGAALLVAVLGAGAWWVHGALREVQASAGAALFDAHCALCHGERASGTGQGPPLVHRVYEPGHHPDAAFHRAVEFGVLSHHWEFGNMAPVAGVSKADVDKIVAYVRELQRSNGIY